MPKVPTYTQQVSPATPNIQIAPSIPKVDLSGGMSAINKASEANINLGKTLTDIGAGIAKHAEEQIKLKNEQVGQGVYTQYARDMQDKLFSDQQQTVKINGQDVTRPVGVMNRELAQADGAHQELDDYYFGTARNQYLSQIPNAEVRGKVAAMMDTHYSTVRGTVMSHQAQQGRADLVNTFGSSVKQQVDDAYGASNPVALSTAIDNAVITQHNYNQAKGFDPATSDLALQATTASVVENSVMGKLKGTGDVQEAKNLLESVKEKLSDKSYSDIKGKIRSSAKTIEEQAQHEATTTMVNNRFDMVNRIASGQLTWDNSGQTIKGVALVDKDLAEAMQQVVNSQGKYQPENQVNDVYQKMVTGIFSSSSNQEISKFLIDAMNSAGNGKISRDRLAILVNAATNRAKSLPTVNPDGVPLNPGQVAIDAGLKAANGWYESNGSKDLGVFDHYLSNIQAGKTPKESYDLAVKTSVVKEHPELAAHDDVPQMVIGKDSPIRLVFPNTTNIYPRRIFNPSTGKLEDNPQVNKNASGKK